MRISTQQIFGRSLNSMQEANSQLQKTQMQISTGKKILTPADNPYATTRISQVNHSLAMNSQFQRNIDLAQNRLEQQDGLLDGISGILLRVRELTTQAGNGTLNHEDKQFIADELKQRLDQLAGMLNSKDAGGEYVFAGFQGDQIPFVKEQGSYVYQGDEGQRYVQVDMQVNVAVSENGKALFMDIANASYGKVQTTSTTANITAQSLVDEAALKGFYPHDLEISFDGTTFQATANGVAVPVTYDDTTGVVTVAGMEFTVEGMEAGDEFVVETRPKQGILTTLEKLIDGLENEEGQASYFNMIDATLDNLSNAETTILSARSRIGARLNTVETTKEMLGDVSLLNKEVLSDMQDLDYAEAISQLSMQSFVLTAAQQTYAQVSRLSLFDYL